MKLISEINESNEQELYTALALEKLPFGIVLDLGFIRYIHCTKYPYYDRFIVVDEGNQYLYKKPYPKPLLGAGPIAIKNEMHSDFFRIVKERINSYGVCKICGRNSICHSIELSYYINPKNKYKHIFCNDHYNEMRQELHLINKKIEKKIYREYKGQYKNQRKKYDVAVTSIKSSAIKYKLYLAGSIVWSLGCFFMINISKEIAMAGELITLYLIWKLIYHIVNQSTAPDVQDPGTFSPPFIQTIFEKRLPSKSYLWDYG